MATNFYFNNFNASQEQLLIEDLIIESIKIYGQEMYYIPRTINNQDTVYTEDSVSSYDSAFLVEFYIKNVDGFAGDGDFLSKFGVEIRDRVTLTIARRIFAQEVGNKKALVRPREGDIIYFPLNNKIFMIKFVEHEAIFYQLGALQTFDLICELFEYSGERFNTGIPLLDELDDPYKNFDVNNLGLLTEEDGSLADEEEGLPILFEEYSADDNAFTDNDFYQQQGNNFIDFTEIDPFTEGRRY